MKPQINLLEDLNHDSQGLSARSWLSLFGLGALIIVAVSAFQIIWNEQLKSQLEDRQAALKNTNERLAETQAQFPNLARESQLQEEEESLRASLERQQTVLRLLSTDNPRQTKGFYPYLQALSASSVSGLWLTEFSLLPGPQQVRLKGEARSPDLVSDYIEILADSHFKGTSFKHLVVKQSPLQQNIYQFEIASRENMITGAEK